MKKKGKFESLDQVIILVYHNKIMEKYFKTNTILPINIEAIYNIQIKTSFVCPEWPFFSLFFGTLDKND